MYTVMVNNIQQTLLFLADSTTSQITVRPIASWSLCVSVSVTFHTNQTIVVRHFKCYEHMYPCELHMHVSFFFYVSFLSATFVFLVYVKSVYAVFIPMYLCHVPI